MNVPRILVVGSSNTDLIVRAERLPSPGETVLGGDLQTAAGGKGANQAVAAARLGAAVTLVARVGNDAYGQASLAALAREGLDTRYVVIDEETPSGAALIVVAPGGENLIAVAPGANGRLSPADVAAAQAAFENADVLLLQLESPLETVEAAARLGEKHGLLVVLNPAPARDLPDGLLAIVDVLSPNEHEAAALTGETDHGRAAEALLARGAKTVVVTLGAAGAWVATREVARVIPGYCVEAIDATAAGDAFNGALAVALARRQTLFEAVRFAHAAAALSTTRSGAQPSLPTAEEVARLLEHCER
jgi:ribokinase